MKKIDPRILEMRDSDRLPDETYLLKGCELKFGGVHLEGGYKRGYSFAWGQWATLFDTYLQFDSGEIFIAERKT